MDVPTSARTRIHTHVAKPSDEKDRQRSPLLEVLDAFGEQAHALEGPWDLNRVKNARLYETTLQKIVELKGVELFREYANPLYERIGWQCTCTCKAHGRQNCPECLNSQGCPIHSDFELDQVDKEVLLEPQELAFNMVEEMAVILGAPKSIWNDLDDQVRLALIETCRRVVSSAVAATVQSEAARLERMKNDQMRGD